MWKGTFRLGGDVIEAIVDGNNLMFYDTSNQTTTTIEGLKISKAGVLIEFPDLKDEKEWKKISIERFKEYYKKMNSEDEKIEYIKKELKKHGYEPLYKQRAGFRPQKFK